MSGLHHVLLLAIATAAFVAVATGQGFPFYDPTYFPSGSNLATVSRMGSECSAWLYNSSIFPCYFPAIGLWGRNMDATSGAVTGYASGSTAYFAIGATAPLYPYASTTIVSDINWQSTWNGRTVEEWMTLDNVKFNKYTTFVQGTCGGGLNFVTETREGVVLSQGNIGVDPTTSAVEAIISTIEATPLECRGTFLFNYLTICSTVPAQVDSYNCNPPLAPGGCFDTKLRPDVYNPSYSTIPWPTNPAFQGFPFTNEYGNQASYSALFECTNWGYNAGPFSGFTWNTTGTGVRLDTGYPGAISGTTTFEMDDPEGCYAAVGSQFPYIHLQQPGLYNRWQFSSVRVDETSPNEYPNPYDMHTTRIMPVAQPFCDADAPRQPNSPILSENNILLYSPICRVSFPFNATLYGSGDQLERYLNVTDGWYQPSADTLWVEKDTIAHAAFVNNLPADHYKTYLNITVQPPINFWDSGNSVDNVPVLDNATLVEFRMGNGQYVTFTQPNSIMAAADGVYIKRKVGSPWVSPFVYIAVPFTSQWAPPCRCNTTADAFDGNVLCDATTKNLIRGRAVTNPAFQPGQFTTTPNCSIQLGVNQTWFGNTPGFIAQGREIGFVADLGNATTSAGFFYQWYTVNSGGNPVEFSTLTLSSTRVVVPGENNVTIGLAVTSTQSRLTGVCTLQLTIVSGFPIASLVAYNESVTLNTSLTLDGSDSLSTNPNYTLAYAWSIIGTRPDGLAQYATFTYTDRAAVPFQASVVGLYVILLRVTTGDSTATRQFTVLVYNGTLGLPNYGIPDTPVIPSDCFNPTSTNITLPFNRPFTEVPPIPPPPPTDTIGPLLSGSTQETGALLFARIKNAERMIKLRQNRLEAIVEEWEARAADTPSQAAVQSDGTSILILGGIFIAIVVIGATASQGLCCSRRNRVLQVFRQYGTKLGACCRDCSRELRRKKEEYLNNREIEREQPRQQQQQQGRGGNNRKYGRQKDTD